MLAISIFFSLRAYIDDDTQVLGVGHTYKQSAMNMARFDSQGWVVNPGSVGQPRDGNAMAAYAFVDLYGPLVELYRTEYDIERVQQAHESTGFPMKAATRLEEGI